MTIDEVIDALQNAPQVDPELIRMDDPAAARFYDAEIETFRVDEGKEDHSNSTSENSQVPTEPHNQP